MKNEKKIGVWGLGKHAINNILPAINDAENISLYGCYSRDEKVVQKVSSRFKIKKWSSSLEMLRDESLDVVYLSTPPQLHYEQGIEILNSGKHFW